MPRITAIESIGIMLIMILFAAIIVSGADQTTAKPVVIRHCQVASKQYDPAYSTTDDDGTVTQHPPRWHIIVTPTYDDVDVAPELYYQLKERQRVDVLVRKGGLVGVEYKSIAPHVEEE